MEKKIDSVMKESSIQLCKENFNNKDSKKKDYSEICNTVNALEHGVENATNPNDNHQQQESKSRVRLRCGK